MELELFSFHNIMWKLSDLMEMEIVDISKHDCLVLFLITLIGV